MASCKTELIINNHAPQYFEGTEKLLEIWFINHQNKSQGDLRKIPRSKFESLLKLVRCEIISYMSNEHVDAYVLSESSLFVSKRRLILKTCGTTTPLLCLGSLLHLAKHVAGFTAVQEIFYSRKNYGRPELQRLPHKTFEQEVTILDSFFNTGSAYCLGSPKQGDYWYLYTINPAVDMPSILISSPTKKLNDCERLIENFRSNNNNNMMLICPDDDGSEDQTLEILMTNLDPNVMSIFTKQKCIDGAEATKKSGIDKLIPNMAIDDFLFDPCGYSMNGITKSGHYMTIHITPEQGYSYVSFETNIPAASYRDLIVRVLKTFQPSKAIVTIFANHTSLACDAPQEMDKFTHLNETWLQQDIQHCRFKHYDLTYALYNKFPS